MPCLTPSKETLLLTRHHAQKAVTRKSQLNQSVHRWKSECYTTCPQISVILEYTSNPELNEVHV